MMASSNRDSVLADRPHGLPTAISADLMTLPSARISALMASLVGLVGVFVIWSSLAHITEFTAGHGRVIPASKIQVVQNLEGGIVREILVREGALVHEGDVLVRIDPTIADASLGEAREKIFGLMALIARLEAEVNDTPLTFPQAVLENRPDLAGHQREYFDARARELQAALSALSSQEQQRTQEIAEIRAKIATLQRSLELAREELTMISNLEKERAASRAELIAAQTKVNELQGALTAAELALPRMEAAVAESRNRRQEKLSNFRGDVLQRLTSARVELSAAEEASRSSADKVTRTTVRAPATGIVKTVAVTTPGQVIQPGHNLMEIVPLNDTLLVEAQVRPQDVAFLHPGQVAKVKITAYDSAIFGSLPAHVEQIGADSITTEKGETYYLIRVRTDANNLEYRGQSLPIIPGMVADVDVITGSKTVLTYLTKPLIRMRDVAMRER